MTSFVGLSTAVREKLEQRARKLTGPLVVTLHKASHLKNIALSTAGAASSVYAVLSVGGPDGGGSAAGKGIVHQSVVKRLGGPHPQWEQQFLFWLGEEGPEGTAPASSATGAHDGSLHVRLHDRARGDECIGRLDINFVQLLSPSEPQSLPAEPRPMSPPAAAPRSITNDSSSKGVTRWLALTDRKDLRATVGWLCLSASFKGKGLEEQEASPAAAAAAATTPIANGHATEQAEVAKPEEGEHAIPELTDPELIVATASKRAAAGASAEDDAADPSEAQQEQSPSQPSAPISEVFTLLHSPKSSAPSIVLSLPNPYLHNAAASAAAIEGADESASTNNTRPIPPPPADPVTYQSAPGAEWPLPRQTPPAPGYPVSPTPPASSSTSSSRPSTRAGASTRPAFAAGATSPALPLSPTAARGAAAGKEDAELHAAAAAATLAAELAQASLVTAYDRRHEHILQLLPRLPAGRFLCASCAGEGTAAVWHCVEAGCGFELHEQCLQEDAGAADDDDEEKEEEPSDAAGADHALNGAASPDRTRRSGPELRMDRRHTHPLVWREQLYPSGTYLCGGCGGGGSGGAWHCRSCVFDLHPECMR